MICRICGVDAEHKEYEVREMMLGYFDLFLYYKCDFCDCLQIKEIPNDIEKFYGINYYSFNNISTTMSSMKRMRKKLKDFYYILGENKLGIGKFLYNLHPFEYLPFEIMRNHGIGTEHSILDVGCGSGEFLHRLASIGFKKLYGVDSFIEKDIESSDGVLIKKSTIHKMKGIFDFIVLNHSFEHMPDPLDVLYSIKEKLSDKGKCLIRIPVINYAWEVYGVNWFQIDAPRHYFLYSEKSMKILADKAGMLIEDIIYDSTESQFLASELYKKKIPLKDHVYSKDDIEKNLKLAKKLNKEKRGDQAGFVLIKQ